MASHYETSSIINVTLCQGCHCHYKSKTLMAGCFQVCAIEDVNLLCQTITIKQNYFTWNDWSSSERHILLHFHIILNYNLYNVAINWTEFSIFDLLYSILSFLCYSCTVYLNRSTGKIKDFDIYLWLTSITLTVYDFT